uniref:uncharacterized protein n=1 Tax=Pristiophorus japonicus TaxID=55135 RepID=UPI00398F0602
MSMAEPEKEKINAADLEESEKMAAAPRGEEPKIKMATTRPRGAAPDDAEDVKLRDRKIHFFLSKLLPQILSAGFLYHGWQFNPFCGRKYSNSRKLHNTRKLLLGQWNVRTLLDRADTTRPEKRTALIARELQRYNIDIAALSETRLTEEGCVSELGSGYTFYWKGKAENENRIYGIGIAVKTSLMQQFPNLPEGINERLMKLHFPLNAKCHITIISAYAPTLPSPDEMKERFYEDLDRLVRSTPAGDKLIILGDFNARVGKDSKHWKGVIGQHGTGKLNSNGLLLLSMCVENDLTIANTLFRQADKYKTTWMHPRAKQWHMIDHVIVRSRDIKDVKITRAMWGAECWTDHRLVRSTLQLYIAPLQCKRPKPSRSAFNTARLKHQCYREQFQDDLDNMLMSHGPLIGNTTQKWTKLKQMMTDSAKTTLGLKKKIHQDWFDENNKTINQMSTGKVPGKDGILAKIYKAVGPATLEAFHDIITSIWEEEDMPQDFCDGMIVSLYKNKGNKADCGNYRGISLLSIAGKIIARIVLNRLLASVSEANLPETQCGFRPGRSTADMIFALRQVQEKCIEQNMDLYVVFIDLTKAFDTVNRAALWSILTKLGCPRKFVHIIELLFHDNMTGEVLSDGTTTAPFAISNGVKQGCVLAPVLFNLFFICILNYAIKDLEFGVYLKYRLDGSLFDLRRLAAKTKVRKRLILEALFADNCALMTWYILVALGFTGD